MTNEMAVDYGALEDLFKECEKESEAIYAAIAVINNKLSETIENGFWVGADATQFQSGMTEQLNRVSNATKWINQVTHELRLYADKLKEEQRKRVDDMSSTYSL